MAKCGGVKRCTNSTAIRVTEIEGKAVEVSAFQLIEILEQVRETDIQFPATYGLRTLDIDRAERSRGALEGLQFGL